MGSISLWHWIVVLVIVVVPTVVVGGVIWLVVRASRRPPAAPAAIVPPLPTAGERLQALDAQRSQGLLSEDDYQARRATILAGG